MVPAENCKFVSVEACQPFVRTQPEIAIAGLSDGADSVLRQALLLRPGCYRVLRERLVGIEGQGAVSPAEKRQQSPCPQHRRILSNSFALAADDPFGSLSKFSDSGLPRHSVNGLVTHAVNEDGNPGRNCKDQEDSDRLPGVGLPGAWG